MPNNLNRPVGFRHCRIYATNTFGKINATSTTPYEGLEIVGPQALSLTKGAPRPINHIGADRLLAQDVLPATEVSSATITADGQDLAIEALISGANIITQGDIKVLGQVTDNQGSEPFVAVLGYSQALDGVTGVRTWTFTWLPLVRLIAQGKSADDNAMAITYDAFPNVASGYPYGLDFVIATDGFAQAQYVDGAADNKPHVAAFLADGVAATFTFHTDRPAASATKIRVYEQNGTTGVTTDVTASLSGTTVTDFTYTAAPTSGNFVYAFYELA